MRNGAELEGKVTAMNLKNRIRYLFLRPLKTTLETVAEQGR